MLTFFEIIWAIICFILWIPFKALGMIFGATVVTGRTAGTMMIADHGIRKVRKYYKES